jgi:hypothetical protein
VLTGGLGSGQVQAPIADAVLEATAATLLESGFVVVAGRWLDKSAAWDMALRIAAAACDLDPLSGLPGFEVVGEFTVPPPGVVQRDFQALHVDYGVPRLAGPPVPVARFTALYLDCAVRGSGAATRIVPLRRLLAQRSWPARDVLVSRVCDDSIAGGPVEGILARIVEAADQSRDLPDREADGFLCGMEFRTLDEERRYFAQHGLRLDAAEEEIVLTAAQLLLFDNLAVGHGRRGRRNAGELHQLCIGFGSLDLVGQTVLLNRFLSGFEHHPGPVDAAAATEP